MSTDFIRLEIANFYIHPLLLVPTNTPHSVHVLYIFLPPLLYSTSAMELVSLQLVPSHTKRTTAPVLPKYNSRLVRAAEHMDKPSCPLQSCPNQSTPVNSRIANAVCFAK
jgi:hypothetical protein